MISIPLFVSAVGFVMWLVSFLMGWGAEPEAYFFGVFFGGLSSSAALFIGEDFLRKLNAKEGEAP